LNQLRSQRGDRVIETTQKPNEHVNLFQREEQGVKNFNLEIFIHNF